MRTCSSTLSSETQVCDASMRSTVVVSGDQVSVYIYIYFRVGAFAVVFVLFFCFFFIFYVVPFALWKRRWKCVVLCVVIRI